MRTQSKLWLLSIGVICSIGMLNGNVVAASSRTTNALWVFSDEVTNQERRSMLIQRSSTSGVNALYLSVYQSVPNSSGRLMNEERDIADLVRSARQKKIRVWAAYGAPDWPTLGCNKEAFPLQRMAEIINYNKANPQSRFQGVVLDVEPLEPQSEADFQSLLKLYQCIRSFLPRSLGLTVAIRFFWDTPVTFPTRGEVRPAYQHIINMNLSQIVVMGYRDVAGSSCPDDGVICLHQDEIEYANSHRKKRRILVGLETGNCAPDCGPENVTFFEEGQSWLNIQAQNIASHFRKSPSFGGFAIHRYNDAYLSGLTDWPATNPTFP